jgi:hypothetical protein
VALPQRQDLTLYRGDTAPVTFRLWEDTPGGTPTDLTDVVARAQIRDVPIGELLAELGVAVTLPNEITVTMPASAWDGFPRRSSAAWDLELTYAGGVVATLVAGLVTIAGDVTAP